ncbi:IS66-like element accessory protein TnpA [Acidocella facilis]|uniref:IS66-like element accessory protein TnpA n=1 Tax=Acidocella facilis TaxID=525 RepID=UPI001B80D81A|nr:transposase [Acidocella facilis]
MADGVEVESVLRTSPELGFEVLSGVSKRRIWSTEEKLRILAQFSAPGSSPALACRAHGISTGQFYTWRKQFRSGELTGFVPVSVMAEPPSQQAPALVRDELLPTPAVASGLVEVELPSGVKLRISGEVEAMTLRRILSALR